MPSQEQLDNLKIDYENLINRGYDGVFDMADEIDEELEGSIFRDEIYELAEKQKTEMSKLVKKQAKEFGIGLKLD